MAWTFRTVPDELVGCAEATALYYKGLGYSVYIEHSDLGYPSTPTLQAKRGNTTIVVEVAYRFDEALVRRWIAYGKSSGQDFRVVIAFDTDAILGTKVEKLLRDHGVGCVIRSPGSIVERIPAADLALNVELPHLAEMPAKVRRSLGPAYEHFERGNWREGFSDACQAFETEARKYLKRHSRTGRLKVLRKTNQVTLTAREIDRMTMGQLSQTFKRVVIQNRSDSVIGDTLSAVNKDRVGVSHKKTSRTVESRLRKNVGRHMWTLFSGFREVTR